MHDNSAFACLPQAPYYIVAFSSQLGPDDTGYGDMADKMIELAHQQAGFLGIETARETSGFGITNSYWKDMESIRQWKLNVDHLAAQKQGRALWYEAYALRIARVERAYDFNISRN